jgi:hypothetical protein
MSDALCAPVINKDAPVIKINATEDNPVLFLTDPTLLMSGWDTQCFSPSPSASSLLARFVFTKFHSPS